VEQSLLNELDAEQPIAVLATSDNKSKDELTSEDSFKNPVTITLGGDEPKQVGTGRASRFFRKKE
jgi:hypothetical protein